MVQLQAGDQWQVSSETVEFRGERNIHRDTCLILVGIMFKSSILDKNYI